VILVDTSIWVDHLRAGDPKLAALLHDGQVLTHPWVIGELALGQLSRRGEILGLLRNLPQAKAATDAEATMLTTGAACWTRDKRLAAVAVHLGLTSDEMPKP